MKKKFACLAMAMVMVLSLAACGGKKEEAPAAAPAESGSDSSVSVFKVGTIGPLSGDAAIYGQAVANGAKIAVDEINAAGGAIQFELQSQDDEADGEKSVNAYNTLMDWGMQVMVGPTTTGASIAVSAQANADRTFMLTPSASSVDVIDGKDNVFQVCFTDPNQGVASADYISANMAGAKVAVIYRNDDAYSQGIRDTFVSEAADKGLEVVYEGTFTAKAAETGLEVVSDTTFADGNDTDFSVQLKNAQDAGADLVFLPMYYQPASLIFAQAASMSYAPTWFGVDGMDGILTMEGFDTSLAEGVMLLTPFNADSTDERTQNFVKKYQEQFGEVPNQFAADAYDCVYAYKQALDAAGATPDMSNEELCDLMIKTFTGMTFDGLTGQGMTWSASGEVSKAPMAVVIENGTYVLP